MSQSSANYAPMNDDNKSISSADSISAPPPAIVKNPYKPWFVVPAGKPIRTPENRYGPENHCYFTLQISHGGSLVDRPGLSYRKSTVSHVEAVNVNRFDLQELCLIARELGYNSMGKWYYMDDDPSASLDLLPMSTEAHLASFRERVRGNNFLVMEKVLVEHENPSEFLYLPKDVMFCGKKRIEKVLWLLIMESPNASVAQGAAQVKAVTQMDLPRSKIARVMKQAREKLGCC